MTHVALTFEHWADPAPDWDAAAALVLSEGELHVEEGQPAEDEHDEVGDEEGTCRGKQTVVAHTAREGGGGGGRGCHNAIKLYVNYTQSISTY